MKRKRPKQERSQVIVSPRLWASSVHRATHASFTQRTYEVSDAIRCPQRGRLGGSHDRSRKMAEQIGRRQEDSGSIHGSPGQRRNCASPGGFVRTREVGFPVMLAEKQDASTDTRITQPGDIKQECRGKPPVTTTTRSQNSGRDPYVISA